MAKKDGPTHPHGFWKVHGYVVDWFGLWTRGCAKKELCSKVSIELFKKCLSLSLSPYIYMDTHTHTCSLRPHKNAIDWDFTPKMRL